MVLVSTVGADDFDGGNYVNMMVVERPVGC
jgi:hypothetical protein